MDDSLGVRRGERRGELDSDPHRLLRSYSRGVQAGAEVLALEPLHDQVHPVLGPAMSEVGDDARVPQAGENLDLATEAFGPLDSCENLDRDRRAGLAIVAAMNHAHPSSRRDRPDLEPSVEDGTLTHRHLALL